MNTLIFTLQRPGGGHNYNDVDLLDSLLGGELTAVDSYEQAIPRFKGGLVATELRRIRDEHQHTVNTLRDRIHACGKEPAESARPWDAVASLVMGPAGTSGQQTVLHTLQQSEEHRIDGYLVALADHDLSFECRTLIGTTILPQCHQHVATLDWLIGILAAN